MENGECLAAKHPVSIRLNGSSAVCSLLRARISQNTLAQRCAALASRLAVKSSASLRQFRLRRR